MESQIEKFIPKYTLWNRIEPIVYLGVAAFLVVFSIFVSTLPYGGDPWEDTVYSIIGFCLVAIYESSKIIKTIEFGENKMVVRRYLWTDKVIAYREIKRIVIEWSYIDATKLKIYYDGMINQEQLLSKVANTLKDKNIRDINLADENKKSSNAYMKRLRYAFLFTIVIGVVVGVIAHADWSIWSITLVALFIVTALLLSIFIKS